MKITESEIDLQFIYHLSLQTNLVIVMLMCQISDLACQISIWFWSWIVINTQLIMFVNMSIALWSWNITDSYNLLEFLWETWIFQVLIIIIQNIILLQVVSYYRFYSSIWQHSVFMKKRQLNATHHSCHIVEAHFSEHDQTSQLWEHIQDQNWSMQVLIQLWIVSSNY